MSFVDVLAIEPGDRRRRGPRALANGPADRGERVESVLGQERRRGSGGEGLVGELGPAADGDEEIPGLPRAGSRRSGPSPRVAPSATPNSPGASRATSSSESGITSAPPRAVTRYTRARPHPGWGVVHPPPAGSVSRKPHVSVPTPCRSCAAARGASGERPRITTCPPPGAGARRARPRGRRTAASRSANSCPCSWPLPAITTTSPSRRGRAPLDRRGAVGLDLGVAVGSGERLGDDRVRILAARIVGGDDRRRPRARDATPPMSGRLARSRSPPQPNTHHEAAASARSRASASTFASASGVCA